MSSLSSCNALFRVGIAILVLVFLGFLACFLESLLKLIQLLAQLCKALPCGIRFLSAFLGGTEIGFLLSILIILTTILGIVRSVCVPMLLA